ncbi:multidrug effflux MFS transporter [Coxiella burnetii]|uniref:multidrug effflux MFS transporter n=1 Tax=Coxiella burnetii TaxID=777 RepID=UPI00057C4472|nr:multidrug effflux MFS transporter [Coxiella burnetii]
MHKFRLSGRKTTIRYKQHMKKNLIVILTSVFVTVGQFAMALYLPALPALTTYFHTFPDVIQLSLTLFLIAFGFSQLFYGSLSDCYGRKPLLLIGLVIVMIGFLIAVFARHLSLLLIARVVQGLGAGSVSVLARAIIRDRFEGKKLVQALSLLIMAASLAPMIAPFIGGHIQHRLGWHSIFIFLFFYSGLILLGIFFLLPETKKTESVPFKMGALLNNYKLLLRHPIYIKYVVCIIMAYACQILYLSISPFIFQNGLKLNAAQYGTIITLPAIGYFVGNFLSTRLIRFFDSNHLVFVGALIVVMAGIALALEAAFNGLSAFSVITPIIFCVIGIGLIYPNVISGALSPFPQMAGTAAALSGAIQMAGTSSIAGVTNALHVVSVLGLGISFLLCGAVVLLMIFRIMRTSVQ